MGYVVAYIGVPLFYISYGYKFFIFVRIPRTYVLVVIWLFLFLYLVSWHHLTPNVRTSKPALFNLCFLNQHRAFLVIFRHFNDFLHLFNRIIHMNSARRRVADHFVNEINQQMCWLINNEHIEIHFSFNLTCSLLIFTRLIFQINIRIWYIF